MWDFFSVAKFAKLKTHKIINKVIDSTDLTTVGNPWKKPTDGLYFNILKNHKLIIKC